MRTDHPPGMNGGYHVVCFFVVGVGVPTVNTSMIPMQKTKVASRSQN